MQQGKDELACQLARMDKRLRELDEIAAELDRLTERLASQDDRRNNVFWVVVVAVVWAIVQVGQQ